MSFAAKMKVAILCTRQFCTHSTGFERNRFRQSHKPRRARAFLKARKSSFCGIPPGAQNAPHLRRRCGLDCTLTRGAATPEPLWETLEENRMDNEIPPRPPQEESSLSVQARAT